MTHLSRRGFLVGLVVAFTLPRDLAASETTIAIEAVDGYLAIGADGTVTVYSGKVDLGTGSRAAYRQVVAEELGCAIERIVLIEGDTALTPNQGVTAGSNGIPLGALTLRQAAATARGKLFALAAARLGKPASELDASDGVVRGGGAEIAFGDLVGGQQFDITVDKAVKLKDPAEFRFIGKSYPRPDLADKFTARHIYVHDFKLPGMLHGYVLRPPSPGAVLEAVDDASVAGIPGLRIVRLKNFLGIVAPKEWDVVRAARVLRASWREQESLPGSDALYASIRAAERTRTQVLRNEGDAAAALASGKIIEATYQWPMQGHASMGPSCAVADVRADSATIWTASQGTHKYQPLFANFLGLKVETVRLVYLDGAGCYGMNGHDDAAADAVLLSQAVGAPVRVQWTRADEHAWDPKGPAQLLDLRARIDPAGLIAAWETTAFLPAATPNLPAVPLLAVDAAGLTQPQGFSSGQTQQNIDPPYATPHLRTAVHWLKSAPLRLSNLRAPGKIANVFAVESFTDEIAALAGADPLAFRLRGLRQPRGVAVLERVAEMMAWRPRPFPQRADPAAPVLHGRGIAYCHYKQSENFVAMAMEVEVTRATGAIRVTRIVCAHDCGMMVNPDAVRAQVEGNILQTLSRTLFEEVIFDRMRVTSTDWASYPILTFPDVPKLEIALIDRPRERPIGAGEAASAPVAAAVGNAVFDATGVRLRTVPLTPGRVRAALVGVGM